MMVDDGEMGKSGERRAGECRWMVEQKSESKKIKVIIEISRIIEEWIDRMKCEEFLGIIEMKSYVKKFSFQYLSLNIYLIFFSYWINVEMKNEWNEEW